MAIYRCDVSSVVCGRSGEDIKARLCSWKSQYLQQSESETMSVDIEDMYKVN